MQVHPSRWWLISLMLLLAWGLPAHAGNVMLAWNSSQGALGYHLYYGITSGAYSTVVDTGAATTANITLTDGTHYYFAATAFNDEGESGYSNEVSAFPGTPISPRAVNAGGPQFTASDGVIYAADMWFNGGATYSTTANIAGTNDDTLYRSERYGNFTYTVPVPNGTYLVTLKFAEIYWNQAGRRIFDVLIEGQQVISNLDIYAQVGRNRAYDRTFTVPVSDGALTIQFRTDRDQAKVSAIKIVAQ